MKRGHKTRVSFLNPRTCGIYKSGGPRFKTDPTTGQRTEEIDNELIEHVEAYLAGKRSLPGKASVALADIYRSRVLVPTYYDQRYNHPIQNLLEEHKLSGITLGDLLNSEILTVRGGHGSPGNDQRSGSIPYIKVSDIRALRVNVNPTNLVSESVARRFWKGDESGLKAWDIITPNRASNNIGEFAIILPGEEQIVVTKEVFVFRVIQDDLYDPFYLLWALSLEAVREQWRRIALMQTNREDCGNRYREIVIPKPPNKPWAKKVSRSFREYFTAIASARESLKASIDSGSFIYVASANPFSPIESDSHDDEDELKS
jgi:type I restriction enzyme M protein